MSTGNRWSTTTQLHVNAPFKSLLSTILQHCDSHHKAQDVASLLPEWLCGIASSAPLQTWLLHGGSSWGYGRDAAAGEGVSKRERESTNLGS